MLISYGYTGYLSTISNLARPAAEWHAGGIPLTGMMNLERRSGRLKPVIKKMLVDLNGAPFRYFAERRERWAVETCYTLPRGHSVLRPVLRLRHRHKDAGARAYGKEGLTQPSFFSSFIRI